MKNYQEPTVEIIDFAAEAVMDGTGFGTNIYGPPTTN